MSQNQNPFNSLGLFTYLRTYARRHNEEDPKSTVESWEECIRRVVKACNSQLNIGLTDQESEEVFNMLYNLKCSVAGRFLWQLGTKTVDKLGLMSLQNCAFTTVDHPITPFTWVMNFLMLGAGCGYRITQEDLDKFPPVLKATITRDDNPGADFIVPDSRQGWIKLLGKVLKAHFYSGSGFNYSCHCLRSKGAPIKSFGGLASGPDVLCDGLNKISEILNKRASSESNRLTTVEALDIMNIIGMIVVSGNVRRCLPKGAMVHTESGLIPIEKIKIEDKVLTTKGYYKVNNVFYQGVQEIIVIKTKNGDFKCTANHKMAVVKDLGYAWKQAQNLEPNKNKLLFLAQNLDVYPKVWRSTITELVLPSEIIEVEPHGEAETYDIEVDEMHEFFCDGFLTHNSAQIALGDCSDSEYLRAKRWDLGSIPNWRCYSNNSVICNDIEEVLNNDEFWEGYNGNGEPYGLINLDLSKKCGRLGETQYADPEVKGYNPCVSKYTWVFTDEGPRQVKDLIGKKCKLYLNGDLYETTDAGFYQTGKERLFKVITKEGFSIEATRNHKFMKRDGAWCELNDLKEGDELIINNHRGDLRWGDDNDREFGERSFIYLKNAIDKVYGDFIGFGIIRFLSNIFERGSYEFYQGFLSKTFRETEFKVGAYNVIIQRMLLRLGIYSKIEDGQVKAVFNIDKNDNLISPYSTGAYYATFSEIEGLFVEEVYDCTVPDMGAFDANGFYVHNCAEQSLCNRETCCLAEIYLPNIESKESLVKYAKYLYRICKHSLALKCADSKETEDIVHKNMRMGIGVTGYLQATEEQRTWLSDCYTELRKFDEEYSSLKGFPTSIKLTTCKPSGTLSILGGCTSGVHPGYAQYYIRRIRVSSESGLIKIARDHGYPIEYVQNFDGTLDHSTQVISFPMSLPEGTVLAENCTAVQQLEWVKRLQTDWSDNSVSCTVYYRKEELSEIKEWLRKHYNDSVKTVSFLLHSEHGFKQAPLEKITKEEYLEMMKTCKPITSVAGICYSESDEKNVGEGECAGGACPLK